MRVGVVVVATGRDPGDAWPFYLAFNFYRLAAIAQGVAKRALMGNASSEQAANVGAMTAVVAGLGLDVARQSESTTREEMA